MHFLRPVLLTLAASASVNAHAHRQYHQRSLVDICANVDADLAILDLVLGRLDLCLCVSAIPKLLSVNLLLRTAVLLFGDAAVTAAVTALINDATDHKQCYYPEHAVPKCDINPCDFSCDDGFKPYPPEYPTSCVCEYPNTVCNGVCGYFPACSSQKVKRDATWRDATCPHGWSACGLWGGSKRDYECVDVQRDLWSCGGCGIPLLSTDPAGVDCTAIPGVLDVSCLASRCVVRRCKSGFQISADETTCVPTTRTSPNVPVLVHNGAGPFKARDGET